VQVRCKLDVKSKDVGEQRLKNILRPVRVYRLDDGGASATPQPDLRLQESLSIAVLPFQNLSGDATQDYFSDGITEDIITKFSHFRSLFVIARNSSFSLRGRIADVGEIGRHLGV
jgi:adenylate cyclase